MQRPPKALIGRYQRLLTNYSPSCLVTDAQGRVGALSHGFFPVKRHKIAGPALTVNLDIDDLVDCMPILTQAKSGDVLVLACHEEMETAMCGGLMSRLCKQIGVAGVVVDGTIRDTDEIRDLDFPIWSKGTVPRPSPTAVHGRTEPVQVNVPVVVGRAIIHPGDIIVADEIGICVVPQAHAEQVIIAAEKQAAKENDIRERIMSGTTLNTLLEEFGHL